MFVVVTGLHLRTRLYHPVFLYHALHAFRQAQRDPEILHASARHIAGVHLTLTAWPSAAVARNYASSGAHRRAAAVFTRIATGRIYKGEHARVPDWDTARQLWDRDAVLF